ncbi:putative bifunctional dTTP/UTP pyrophosphatase/methyltransferase protein [Rhynchocyon petersi]
MVLCPVIGKLLHKRVVLASASPRRREILSQAGFRFEVVPSRFKETLDKTSFATPYAYAIETAKQKALEVAHRMHSDLRTADVVIGADTIVTVGGLILEKPVDKQDAYRMLSRLSGKEHSVFTGVAIVHCSSSGGQLDTQVLEFHEETRVTFSELSEDLLWEYIHSGEPMDKAGGYGIQALGGMLVERVSGDFFNVVGFPLNHFCKELARLYYPPPRETVHRVKHDSIPPVDTFDSLSDGEGGAERPQGPPCPMQLLALVEGFRASKVLFTACRLRVFDVLQGGLVLPAEDLAGHLDASMQGTRWLLEACTALRLLVPNADDTVTSPRGHGQRGCSIRLPESENIPVPHEQKLSATGPDLSTDGVGGEKGRNDGYRERTVRQACGQNGWGEPSSRPQEPEEAVCPIKTVSQGTVAWGYGNTQTAELFLASQSPHSLHTFISLCNDRTWEHCSHLEAAVREGSDWLQRVSGTCTDHPFQDPFSGSKEDRLQCMRALHEFTRLSAHAVATAFDLSTFTSACHLGGCTGALAHGLAQEYQHLQVTVVDCPEVIELAPSFHPAAPHEDRVSFVAGDILCDELPEADLYLLWGIPQDDGSGLGATQRLLDRVSEHCRPGAALLVAGAVLDEERTAPPGAQVHPPPTLGSARTAEDYRRLLQAHGFREVRVVCTGTPLDAVLATR